MNATDTAPPPAPTAREIDRFLERVTDRHADALLSAERSGRGCVNVYYPRAAHKLASDARRCLEGGDTEGAGVSLAAARHRFAKVEPIGLL